MGRPMKDIMLLDNSGNSYLFQPENALPIVSWYDNMSDQILFDYIPILQGLSVTNDVREVLALFCNTAAPYEDQRVEIPKAL